MAKTIRIKHDDIRNPQTITPVMKEVFAKNDLNIHRNEVKVIEDDHDKGLRVLEVETPRSFVTLGDLVTQEEWDRIFKR